MSGLADHLASLLAGAEPFKAEHGSVECIVHPDSDIAKARVTEVAGVRVVADALSFISRTTGERSALAKSEVYFHTADDLMFGSKSEHDEWWDE